MRSKADGHGTLRVALKAVAMPTYNKGNLWRAEKKNKEGLLKV
jgi:hypothetical protein